MLLCCVINKNVCNWKITFIGAEPNMKPNEQQEELKYHSIIKLTAIYYFIKTLSFL